MNQNKTPITSFGDLGLSSRLLESLTSLNLITPTPIQSQSIPVGLEGKDILGVAQTGTGKTLAFGIPIIHRLDTHKGTALVIVPTRELAQQVREALAPHAKVFNMKTACLIGGESMDRQLRELAAKPRIIIATPGRLIDMIKRRRVNLLEVTMVALDEADRMFDMGFAPQLEIILSGLPKEKQMLLFSATLPTHVVKLATKHMELPVRVEVAPAGTSAANIEQEIIIIPANTKLSLLEKILTENQGTALVFTRTKQGAKKVTNVLKQLGHKVAEIHSNRTQAQRREAMNGFRVGKYRILVATDIAARGIDVNDIEVVVNFDLPDNVEDYVHRIGRTGRAGKKGRAISFVTPDQKRAIYSIEKLIRKTITVSKAPVLQPLDVKPVFSNFDGEESRDFGHRGPRRDGGRGGNSRGGSRGGFRKESSFGDRGDRPSFDKKKNFRKPAGEFSAPRRESSFYGDEQKPRSRPSGDFGNDRRPSSFNRDRKPSSSFGDRKPAGERYGRPGFKSDRPRPSSPRSDDRGNSSREFSRPEVDGNRRDEPKTSFFSRKKRPAEASEKAPVKKKSFLKRVFDNKKKD